MLLVGVVRRPHGLSGEVSVEVLTDFPDRFTPGLVLRWTNGGRDRDLVVRAARPHGTRVLLTFEGIGDVEAARALAGGELSVPDEAAVVPPADYWYGHQLEGWRCEDRQGRLAGIVRLLEKTAAGPLLSIERADGREALIPFVAPIVLSVDEPGRRVVIDPPEGLLEL
jgi:16S rRNA processing protein RimM